MLAAVEGWGGARATVYNRSMPRALQLVARFPGIARASAELESALDGATLVVNATPQGLADNGFPVLVEHLPPHAAVLDMVYRADETAWVRASRDAGHWAADGRGMLIEQGALSFERWFGVPPDRNAMWTAVS